MVVYSLNHLPEYNDIVTTARKIEKTTIKKGVIERNKIWVDAGGRELIPLGQGKYKRKELYPTSKKLHEDILFDLQIVPRKKDQSTKENEWLDDETLEILLFFCFALSCLSAFFFLGYAVGIRKGKVLHYELIQQKTQQSNKIYDDDIDVGVVQQVRDQSKVTNSGFRTSMNLDSRNPFPRNEFTRVSTQN